MLADLGITVASAAIGLVGMAFASRGANHTKARLERGLGRDSLIEAMAAIDRVVFGAVEPKVIGNLEAEPGGKHLS